MIPNTINICGIPYAVKLLTDNFAVDSHFGEINYTKGEISINADMPEALQMQTLCHEWLHGALVMLGYNEDANNEQFVQALSMAINQTFVLRQEATDDSD